MNGLSGARFSLQEDAPSERILFFKNIIKNVKKVID